MSYKIPSKSIDKFLNRYFMYLYFTNQMVAAAQNNKYTIKQTNK